MTNQEEGNQVSIRLQVLFAEPFWIGILERTIQGELSVCKITFGAEPKEYEVEEFLMEHYFSLKFSPSVECTKEIKEHVNPKRLQRLAKKQTQNTGIGTKSQQALKLQQEQCKVERKARSRQQREAEKQFQFELKQQKRKEKHKGR